MENIRSALITGANGGIGREAAKQLATDPTIGRIVIAARSIDKAEKAIEELEGQTGRRIFEASVFESSDIEGIKSSVARLDAVDALIMNAGGFGGPTPFERNPKGATNIVESNVLGHFILAEELIRADKINKVVLFAGTEAARGIPRMGVKRPKLKDSSVQEFVSIIDGSFFSRKDPMEAYSYAKYLGSLWIGALARKNLHLRILSVSPGGTSGTNVLQDLPWPMKMLFKVIGLRVMPLIGLMHDLPDGAKRYVDALKTASYGSGKFYGSKAKVLTGELVDQAAIFPDLADTKIQDNAYYALAKFV